MEMLASMIEKGTGVSTIHMDYGAQTISKIEGKFMVQASKKFDADQ
jgi:hypothetical protein